MSITENISKIAQNRIGYALAIGSLALSACSQPTDRSVVAEVTPTPSPTKVTTHYLDPNSPSHASYTVARGLEPNTFTLFIDAENIALAQQTLAKAGNDIEALCGPHLKIIEQLKSNQLTYPVRSINSNSIMFIIFNLPDEACLTNFLGQ